MPNHISQPDQDADAARTPSAAALVRVVACGSVDDGKSTLIGRLLVATGSLPEDYIANTTRTRRPPAGPVDPDGPESGRAFNLGTPPGARHGLDYSLLTDGLAAEREQGITIDVAYRHLRLPSGRRAILADAPGHEAYTRNMAVAASTADVALLLVDAARGLQPQTLRHLTICALMGVRRVIVAVNKMDLTGFSAAAYVGHADAVRRAATRLGIAQLQVIPVDALDGDNVTHTSSQMPWHTGPTLLQALDDGADEPPGDKTSPVGPRLPVQYVVRQPLTAPPPDGVGAARTVTGAVSSGRFRVGDRIAVLPSRATARITALQLPAATGAGTGPTPVGIRLEPDTDVARGDVLVLHNDPLQPADRFSADLVWMSSQALARGRSYWLLCGPVRVPATVTAIRHRLDIETGAELASRTLQLNDIGRVEIATDRAVPLDPYDRCRDTGGFLLVDRLTAATEAAGMIRHPLRRSGTITAPTFAVDRAARETVSGHRAIVVWLTGLSGSGKSTIADLAERALHADGIPTYVLDGDTLRSGLTKDLGFTPEDRAENNRRVAEVARLMADAGLVVLVSLISPFRADRHNARQIIGDQDFLEVHVDTPLAVCEARDPRGLYARARAGELPNFTGVGQLYEPPTSPELVIDGSADPVAAAQQLARTVRARSAGEPVSP